MKDSTQTALVFGGLAGAAAIAAYASKRLAEQQAPIVEAQQRVAAAKAAAARAAAASSAESAGSKAPYRYVGDYAVEAGGYPYYVVTSDFADAYSMPWSAFPRTSSTPGLAIEPLMEGGPVAQVNLGNVLRATGRLGGFAFSPASQIRYLYPPYFIASKIPGGFAEIDFGGLYGWINFVHLKPYNA